MCKASSGSTVPIPILHRGNPACQANFLNLYRSKSAIVWNVLSHNTAVIFVSQRQRYEPVNVGVCNVKVPQTGKCREQEEHLICRESLLDKARSVCVCVWRLQSSSCTSTAQMMAVGVLSAVEEATGAFPALAHSSSPSAYQAKYKARAEWDFRRDLQQAKLWRA